MRACWNWQTGTFEGRMSYGVRVQVPLLAPNKTNSLFRFVMKHGMGSSLFLFALLRSIMSYDIVYGDMIVVS